MSKYWFKRRRYGYGWTPVTWQGWLTVIIYVVLILLGSLFLERQDTPTEKNALVFSVTVIVATGILLCVTHYYAPSGKWRWGKKPDDNPEEDF